MKILFALLLFAAVAGSAVLFGSLITAPAPSASSTEFPAQGEARRVTLQQFQALETGIEYWQAVAVLGSSGVETARSDIGGSQTIIYRWDGRGDPGANCLVTFQNGRLVSKAQAGLR